MAAYRFGAFELDEEAGTLRRSGRQVHLAPQPLALLRLLVQHPGALVRREDVRAALWGEGTFVDFDKSLNFVVSRLRVALGDNARAPRFVETVPRHGYRFVAPVERIEAAPLALPAAHAPRPRSRRRGWPLVAAAVLAALAQAGTLPRGQGRKKAAALAALAEHHARLGEDGERPASEAFPAAGRAAQQALALDESAGAWAVLGRVRYLYEWDWAGARQAFERATRKGEVPSGVLLAHARFLSASGEHDRALATLRQIRDGDRARLLHEEGWIQYRARRLGDASRAFSASAAAGPSGGGPESWGSWNRFLILLLNHHRGATQDAAEDALAIMRRNGAPPDQVAAAARAPAGPFVATFLRGSIRFTRSAAERQPIPPTQLAMLHTAVGEHDVALDILARAADARAPSLARSLGDPLFDGLRHDPRFRSLVRRVAPHLLPPADRPRPVFMADASAGG
jgi:DNA-binding winged helix-turn-helix (wHTH) protein